MHYGKYTGLNSSIKAFNILKSIIKQYVVICIHYQMNKNVQSIIALYSILLVNIFYN